MAQGRLRIYLGAAPGVGKTFAMLDEGRRRATRGTDVVVAFVETHRRPNTEAQLGQLEVVPRARIAYRGQFLEEMDIDAVLARHPAVALVDELAHTNVPGSRNAKRWQDIQELLDADIDVISTVNIQHLTSVNDLVEEITGVAQRETVPDAFVRSADQIELVDMTPEALRRRMAHGNIYGFEKVDAALGNYFREGNLSALRELALLWLANRVEQDLTTYRERHGIDDPWETKERVVVALTGAPGSDHIVRRAARMASRVHGELVGVHVRAADGFARAGPSSLDGQRAILAELGGRYAEVVGADVAQSLVDFARAENATQLVMGATARSRWAELTSGSVINRVIRGSSAIDVHVISSDREAVPLPTVLPKRRPAPVPVARQRLGWVLGTLGMIVLAAAISPLRSSLELPGGLLCMLLGVVGVAVVGGAGPGLLGSVVGALAVDFFFTPPLYSLRIAHAADLVAIVVFLAASGIIVSLVDQLSRRGLQSTRDRAEAEALARLAGGAVLATEALPELVEELRRTFDLSSVGVLAPDTDGEWVPIASAGGALPTDPASAPFAAPLSEGTVLVVAGGALGASDSRLLQAFVAQLRQAQERLRLESEAAVATELAEANSLRGALLAAVSHDLRTPLAAIKVAASSVTSEEVDWSPREVKAFCATIDAETDKLTRLVANLLDLSRLQTGGVPVSLGPIAVPDVLYAAVASLAGDGDGIVIDVDDGLAHAIADAGLLERAVANLMSNAHAWSPPGFAVRVDAFERSDRIEIRVIDQGPGIPTDQREAVFRAFQRLGDGTGGGPTGLGLGLAVTRGFVEAMDGTITIEDTPGGGTTMIVSLPIATPN